MHAISVSIRSEGKSIGFVPTMGYLHEGHLSLIKKSIALSDVTVVSIYVNPTQFAPGEDLDKYPRNIERDKKLLINAGVDYLFLPSNEEIYPGSYQTYVHVDKITERLEGEFRPGHFTGVATIVAILFNCVNPQVALFGQKDAQQAAVIKRMVTDLNFNINVVVCPIVREDDGLALSSRNVYLSEKERKEALVLSRALKLAEEKIRLGERDSNNILNEMKEVIDLVDSSNLDYVNIVDARSFELVDNLEQGKEYYILIACKIGSTRLIDNILLSV